MVLGRINSEEEDLESCRTGRDEGEDKDDLGLGRTSGEEEDLEPCRTGGDEEDKEDLGLGRTSRNKETQVLDRSSWGGKNWAQEVIR